MSTTATITESMWQQYEQDGYFVTDVVFDESELAALREVFNDIWKKRIEEAERGGDARTINLTRYRPFIAHLAAESDVCRRTLFHPMLMDIARQVVGGDVDMTYDQTVIKAPSPPRETIGVSNHFAWHQDAYYAVNSHKPENWDAQKVVTPRNGFMGWIAVTRATIDNGCLWAAPGVHKQGLLPHVRDNHQNEWVAQFDASNKKPLELEPGQMLIFTPLTPHYSGPNVTKDETRMAYQFGFATQGTCRMPNVLPVLRGGDVVGA